MTKITQDTMYSMTWAEWLKIGGCYLSHTSTAELKKEFGPMSRWDDVTLGEIMESSVSAKCQLVRFAGQLNWMQEG